MFGPVVFHDPLLHQFGELAELHMLKLLDGDEQIVQSTVEPLQGTLGFGSVGSGSLVDYPQIIGAVVYGTSPIDRALIGQNGVGYAIGFNQGPQAGQSQIFRLAGAYFP